MKRILCLALVLLMLLPMAIACKKDEEPTGTGNSDVAGNNQGEASTDLLATIPSANYGGKDFCSCRFTIDMLQLAIKNK